MVFADTEETEIYVYHYTTRETFLEKIGDTKQIRLSPLRNVNDPRESKEWPVVASWGGVDPPHHILHCVRSRLLQMARDNCKVLCMTNDKQQAPTLSPRIVKDILHRGFGRLRMWAQYGENHAGVCLVFNRNFLDKTIKRELGGRGSLYKGQVHYEDHMLNEIDAFSPDITGVHDFDHLDDILRKHIDQWYQHLYFCKALDWSTEEESRWVLLSDSNQPEFVSIEESLHAVVLGVDFPEGERSKVEKLCEKLKIHVGWIVWDHRKPTLRMEKR